MELRGFVKVKSFQKSEKNSDYSDPTHPPHYPIKKKIGNILKHENNTENTKKHKISKKIKIRVGA